MIRVRSALFLMGFAALCSACDPSDGVRRAVGLIRGQWVLRGRTHPKTAPSPSMSEELQLGEKARKAKENAELLQEVLRVVLVGRPITREEFSGWVNTLNQGASLEGIYNGLTHSSFYRGLEVGAGPAREPALRAFSEILAELEEVLPTPTAFDSSSAQPLPVLNPGEENPRSGSRAPSGPNASPSSEPLPARYYRLFSGASIFTLKRVAGDEALKVAESRLMISSQSDAFEKWYAGWASRLAARGVDFGHPLRNQTDEKFHLESARRLTSDRLQWEMLNRIHRILNEADGRRSGGASGISQ